MDGKLGDSKLGCLRLMKDMEIGQVACSSLTQRDIVDLGKELSKRTVWRKKQEIAISPATVQGYISHLSSVFALAEASYGVPIDETIIRRAKKALKNLQLIDKSDQRERRPTPEELHKLMGYFNDPKTASICTPMVKIIAFAIFSTRRLSEITRESPRVCRRPST